MNWIDRLLGRGGGAKSAPPGRDTRAFSAARVDRLTAGWRATTTSINHELRGDVDRLRARSRDLSKNNDYAKKFKAMVRNNVVGPNGFSFQARVMNSATQPDDLANNAIEAALRDWQRRGVCEITGRMGFADLCRALAGDTAVDGEFIVRRIRGTAARNAYGYALQHIDVDRLATTLNREASGSANAIVMGIEIDAYRRPLYYHLYTTHPSGCARETERVPADDIIHGFIVEYAEQVRGAPWMSAAILTLHHLGEFEQSALLAARKGADTLGFFVSPDGLPPPVGDDTGESDEPIAVSVPGTYDTLPDGYDFKPYDSRYPDAMLADFLKSYLRRAASGLGVSYNSLANDLEGVNFSSIRSGVIEERDAWMAIQNWFAEAFLDVVFADWLDLALLNSAILMPNGSPLPASKRDKFAAHQWQGRRWQWVDPLKDIDASLAAIRAGLQSPYTIASQMGLDLDDVMADLARANASAAASGLPTYTVPTTAPAAPPPDPAGRAGDVVIHNHPPAVSLEAVMPEQPAPQVEVHVEAVMPEVSRATS